jgi:hypothetical protein
MDTDMWNVSDQRQSALFALFFEDFLQLADFLLDLSIDLSRGFSSILPTLTQPAKQVHDHCHDQDRPADPQAPAWSPLGIPVIAAASAEQQYQHNNEQ